MENNALYISCNVNFAFQQTKENDESRSNTESNTRA